jgi:hypothetical protein
VTTSDEFFATLRPSKRYDVAFIDGLHTFEQTYRDVINTFAHLRSGVILIDDTVPSRRVLRDPRSRGVVSEHATRRGSKDDRGTVTYGAS